MPELLSQHEIDSALQTDIPDWSQDGSELVREVEVDSFLDGIDLVTRVAQAHGFIINDCTPSRIRLAPPLVLTADEADSFLAAWGAILDEAWTVGEETVAG